jgi:AbiU2
MTDAERFKKWGDWIMVIYENLRNADLSRRIHNEIAAILQANPRLWRDNNSFYVWMASNYEDSILMAVRRQVDADKQSISLARLLEEIIEYPHVLSRERFIGQVIGHNLPGSEDQVNGMFDHLAGSGANHINADAVRADLSNLQAHTASIKRYTNKRVVHFDAKGPKDSLTVLQVHDALDYLNALREKYMILLRAEKYEEPQLADEETWKDIFREPWIPW